jgi:hypothetical protein
MWRWSFLGRRKGLKLSAYSFNWWTYDRIEAVHSFFEEFEYEQNSR